MYSIITLLNEYGYIVLLIALILELIAFPLPGETLMLYCGFLVGQQKLNWILSILIASSGAIIGITISYFVGRKLGTVFFKKYGHFVHLGSDNFDKTSEWFNKYGNKLLIIAYFIPGIRHITGYFSGITEITYKKFAQNAYVGAILWTATFISLGKVLGSNWEKLHGVITKYLVIGAIIVASIIIVIYLCKNYKQKMVDFTIRMFQNATKMVSSFDRIKVIIAGVAATCLVFLVLIICII